MKTNAPLFVVTALAAGLLAPAAATGQASSFHRLPIDPSAASPHTESRKGE